MGYTIYTNHHKNAGILQYNYQLYTVTGICTNGKPIGQNLFDLRKSFGMMLVIMYAPFNNNRIKWIDWYNMQGYSWSNNVRWDVERYMAFHRNDEEQFNYNRQQLNFLFTDKQY